MLSFKRKEGIKNKNEKALKKASYLVLSKEKDFIVENLSILVSSGMGIPEALDAIAGELRSKRVRTVLGAIKNEINAGSPLWITLNKTKLFKAHVISLIRVGEDSGRLAENLKIVAVQEQKDRIFKSKIRSAMMYPVFVLAVTGFVGIGIAWFILPRLATVFDQLKMDLPLISYYLIEGGRFLEANGAIAIPVFLGTLFALLYFLFFFPKTKFVGEELLLRTPGLKRLIKEVEVARLGFLLGTLLQAGLPIDAALSSLTSATTVQKYKDFYAYLYKKIIEGKSFEESFKESKKIHLIVPSPVQQMIISGERSSSLSDSLIKIGEIYETKIDTTTKDLSVILEPILLVIIWFGVMGVALAVILPIYSLVGDINDRTGAPQSQQGTYSRTVEEDISSEKSSLSASGDTPALLNVFSTTDATMEVLDENSVDGQVVGEIETNATYEYLDYDEGWYEIVLPNGDSGWVPEEFVELING